jgi:acyl carrier protein
MNELLKVLKGALNLDQTLDAQTPLISSGLIDSFQVVVLLDALEAKYRVSIAPEEVDADTFDTPTQILEFINKAQTA